MVIYGDYSARQVKIHKQHCKRVPTSERNGGHLDRKYPSPTIFNAKVWLMRTYGVVEIHGCRVAWG